ASGPTKTSVRLASGIGVDLRVVTEAQYPYALQHFTGSAEHNVALRGRAKAMGLKSNEYGVFREADDSLVFCRTEEEVYQALGLPWIAPELREGMGEIEAAAAGRLPKLVTGEQIQGVFHSHTVASDGHATLEEMVAAAQRLGLTYLGISDHSKAAVYANGLDGEQLLAQHAAIDALNQMLSGFTIFKGIEADILKDGTIDLGPEVLDRCDFVIASIHSRHNETAQEMTDRLCKAIADPHVTMLGHLTGRLLLEREPYELDLDRVFAAAAEHGVLIEINASPSRLDLDWRQIGRAKAAGVRFCINPDAHSTAEVANTAFGVGIARKGGLEAGDLLNTRSAVEVREFLASRNR
ncbi:MAG: DNA polymerase/3'-5' exonuclease PolX, partial [Cyanobacteria bacterium REEB65]|nr:DNA polymerase/3'-5' exonuclease PolX [Cyanobacteria bacterium REEB65]